MQGCSRNTIFAVIVVSFETNLHIADQVKDFSSF